MSTAAPLIGIARLAGEGRLLSQKNRVDYRTLPTRKWMNRCESQRVPFTWTINPYRGCEFGCKYCYARYTHEFMGRYDSASFEREIFAKDWDGATFRAELSRVRAGQSIAIGTATDPYQPAERRYELTRRVLEECAAASGLRLYLTTKSDLIARDADLLRTISERNHLSVAMTVTTADRALARLLEPYAPRPDLRFDAVRKLAEAGLSVTVLASPVLPLITDSPESLLTVAEAARDAGARGFSASPLFLQPSAQRAFFPFLRDQFPHLLNRYRRSFEQGAYLNEAYSGRIALLVERVRNQTGLSRRDPNENPPLAAEFEQLRLF